MKIGRETTPGRGEQAGLEEKHSPAAVTTAWTQHCPFHLTECVSVISTGEQGRDVRTRVPLMPLLQRVAGCVSQLAGRWGVGSGVGGRGMI